MNQLNYEIFAEEGYMARPPLCPTYVFLLDISHSSIKTGFLNTICEGLIDIILHKRIPEQKRTCIGFVLFDNNPHFVYFNDNLEIMTVSDNLTDIFLPVPEHYLLINLEDSDKIIKILENIQNISGEAENLGLKKGLFASHLLLEKSGGKVLTFLCESTIESSHSKSFSFTPSTDFYNLLGEEFIDSNVSGDLFISSSEYCGLHTIGEICRKTGGNIYYYSNLFSNQEKHHLLSDINKAITDGIA